MHVCVPVIYRCQGHVYPPTSPLNSNETCLVPQGVIHQSYSSYAVWNTCPQNWTDRIVRQQCQDEDQNDLLRNLPVFDEDSEVHYRNVFCAKCNGATQKCIPKFQDCHYISPNSKKNGSYCQTECLRYAFPVCSQNIRFRNPQCALCNGFKLNDQDSGCEFDDYGTTPSLTILFDFTSTSKYIVHVKDWKNDVFKNTEKEFSCQTDEVFDPFVGNCKKIVSTRSQATNNTSDDDHLQGKHNESQNWNANCTVIAFNKTDFVQLSNGSIYLKPHNKLYNNMTYMLRDSKLLLCVNFSRNFSRTEKEGGKQTITKTPALLQLLSSIGCFVSMVSLVLLLITYIVFAELRNLTGKIIINLALSLLLYQSLFLSAVKTDDQDTCLAIAVLLHFFVLSFFTWMTVMAYDMRRIFTNISGQGEQECFISQPRALLYSFVLPVALMLIFNMIALGHTVIHIIKTRKRTQQKQNRRHDTRAAVICVKMASVMGVTWILGIAANLKALSFLWYPYVVLNSLQGLFIFLSFAASGKALELYKSKLAGILRNRTPQSEAVKRGNHNCNHTEENRHSRDTRL
ncbi:adhesion G protein-coupled receptor L4-like [Oculina patagonica]